jgi:hypothetical protein
VSTAVRASVGNRRGGASDARPSDVSVGLKCQHALWTASVVGDRRWVVSVEHMAAVGATDATVQHLSVRRQMLLCSVCRPRKLPTKVSNGSIRLWAYEYLLTGSWLILLDILTTL